MKRSLSAVTVVLAIFALAIPFGSFAYAQDQPIPIGAIDFFGYGGMDVSKVQAALPVHVGDKFASIQEAAESSSKIKAAVLQATGKQATNVATVEVEGALLIYIGLPGSTMKPFPLNPVPTGSVHLPTDVTDLYQKTMDAWQKAVASGASDDNSKGYALSSDPDLRAKELAMHDYALQHEDLIRDVLASSSDPKQRYIAAEMLGYAKESRGQIDALVAASHDSDSIVRNNAVRALGVLAESQASVADEIPAETFIEMLNSEKWTDRNKAGWVLDSLTKSRAPRVLSELRSQDLDSLIEMAKWHDAGHASTFRVLLGRIGGIDEARLQKMAGDYDQADIIIAAARNVK